MLDTRTKFYLNRCNCKVAHIARSVYASLILSRSTTTSRRGDSCERFLATELFVPRIYVHDATYRVTGCAVVDATVSASLYRHGNEFPGVYDHATSSNPPLPFQSSRVLHPYACVAVCHVSSFRLCALQRHRECRNWRTASKIQRQLDL